MIKQKFKKGDKIKVLCGNTLITVVEYSEWHDPTKEWKYYFKDEEGKLWNAFEEDIELAEYKFVPDVTERKDIFREKVLAILYAFKHSAVDECNTELLHNNILLEQWLNDYINVIVEGEDTTIFNNRDMNFCWIWARNYKDYSFEQFMQEQYKLEI